MHMCHTTLTALRPHTQYDVSVLAGTERRTLTPDTLGDAFEPVGIWRDVAHNHFVDITENRRHFEVHGRLDQCGTVCGLALGPCADWLVMHVTH